MTNEEKVNLLTYDLMSRVNYWIDLKVYYKGKTYTLFGYGAGRVSLLANPFMSNVEEVPLIEEVKPYLRPMSSMSVEERREYEKTFEMFDLLYLKTWKTYDWLNKHFFDYRGLITMGLALEAPEGMYV